MSWNINTSHTQAGDLVQLVGLRHKSFIFPLQPGGDFHTHRGILQHDDLIGIPWGTQVFSHLGSPFFLLQPALADLLLDLKRNTQILYPKDIGFILTTMGIGPGQKVVEAGTGSGSMMIAFAFAVGNDGHVFSYEKREEMLNLARKNIKRTGLASRVDLKLRDIKTGFDETAADAAFLDVPNPYDYIQQVRAVLKPGGFFCSIIPTFNQAELLLRELQRNKFAFLEMCEIFLRYYKPNPPRLRPTDRMVAHTGFLIFGRRIEPSNDPRAQELLDEQSLSVNELVESKKDQQVEK